jgi:N-acetylgalactosamine 4-sulfate 6-O-sulfotransferase
MRRCFSQLSTATCAWDQRGFRTVTQIQLGMYSEFIQTWLAFFPREQMLILRQEDLIDFPVESYGNATTFLGLPPLPTSAILVRQRSSVGNGTVVKKNTGNYGRGRKTMLPKTRALLDDFYKPFNLKLAALLGDEKFEYSANPSH